MQGQAEPIEWYLARDGKQHGPLSDIEFGKFIELGHLRPGDLVWREGFADWQAAETAFPHVFAPPTPAPRMPASPPAALQHAPSLGGARSEPSLGMPGRADGEPVRPARPEPMRSEPIGGEPPRSEPSLAIEPEVDRDTQREQRRAERKAARRAERVPVVDDGQHDEQGSLGGAADEDHAGGPSRRGGRLGPLRLAMVVLVLAATLGAGVWLLVSKRQEVMTALGLAPTKATRATVAISPPQKIASAGPVNDAGRSTASGEVAAIRAIDGQQSAPLSAPEAAADRRLQSNEPWRLLKGEFPDAYRAHLSKTAKLEADGADAAALLFADIETLVALRRKHQAEALGASLPRLKAIAASFLASLTHLGASDGEACFGFISQGETAKTVVPLLGENDTVKVVMQQFAAVFEAAVEGRRTPRAWPGPRQSDYDLLAQELGTRGWKEADMQLFADPRALAREPAPRVCKMLGDWFAAQLSVRDPDVQLRLLVDALRPVVAG